MKKDDWHLDDAAQARHVATIKNHPDSAEAAQAREELLRAHKPLIRKLALRFAWRDGWLPDLVGAGTAGYLEAVPLFNAKRGALWPYVKRNVVGALHDTAWRLGADAMDVPNDDKLRADLLRLRRLDPRHELDNGQVAEALGVTPERVVELRRLARRAGRLESPIGDGSFNGDSKPRTLGEAIPDEQRLPNWSRSFETQAAALGKGEELGRWVGALYRAWNEDEIGERNRRIVLSHYRAALIAMELDAARDHLQLAGVPILTNRRFWNETDYGYPDGHVTTVRRAETPELAADLDADPDLVIPVLDGHPGLVAQRADDRAVVEQITPQRPTFVILPTFAVMSAPTPGKVQTSPAHTRLCVAWDWPFPQAVPDIAKALGVTERAIYKIIARFNRELAAIRAEEEQS